MNYIGTSVFRRKKSITSYEKNNSFMVYVIFFIVRSKKLYIHMPPLPVGHQKVSVRVKSFRNKALSVSSAVVRKKAKVSTRVTFNRFN